MAFYSEAFTSTPPLPGDVPSSLPTHRMATKTVAMVTGSTSGIGLAIARVLAGTGSDIVLNGLASPQVGGRELILVLRSPSWS